MSVSSPATGLAGRRVLVMGLGRFGGGVGAVRYLLEQGAHVTVTDLGSRESLRASLEEIAPLGVELVLGEHRAQDFESSAAVVVNPAVRPDHPLLERARARDVRITSEIELFLEAVPARVVAVTGTQGKSSTCSLVHQLLDAAGLTVHLGGNYGGSLLTHLDHIAAEHLVVLELSSYQLEALATPPRPRQRLAAAAITNITADHLERHGSVSRYRAAKARLFELCDASTALFLPAADAELHRLAEAAGLRDLPHGPHGPNDAENCGAHVDRESFRLAGEALGSLAELRLPGAFQRNNALLALALARSLGAPAARLAEAIPSLVAPEHRMEPLASVGGREIWDNGVSTTPESTQSALAGLAAGCTLLVGGERKALDYDPLFREVAARNDRVVTFGAAGDWLAAGFRAAGLDAHATAELDEALARAFAITPPGGTLLFSPACASFDAYDNFQARARHFRACLQALAS